MLNYKLHQKLIHIINTSKIGGNIKRYLKQLLISILHKIIKGTEGKTTAFKHTNRALTVQFQTIDLYACNFVVALYRCNCKQDHKNKENITKASHTHYRFCYLNVTFWWTEQTCAKMCKLLHATVFATVFTLSNDEK